MHTPTPNSHSSPQGLKTGETPVPLVAEAAIAVLEQCEALLESLSDEAHRQPSNAMGHSTIGQHLRHALDHFNAILAVSADESGEDGPIEYDRRQRGGSIETDRAAALQGLAEARERIANLHPDRLYEPARVRVMLSADGVEAELPSTLARELAFAAHHAIHHQAMMGAIAREQGLSTPPGFGKAPATLNHEASIER